MAKIDPEQERQRLAEFYAGQLDGELERVAEEAYELSELAEEVLKAELQKRGLSVQMAEHPPAAVKKAPKPGDPPEEEYSEAQTAEELTPRTEDGVHELVAIRQFRDLPAALLAKGSLESAGIDCVLADDNVVRLDWFISNAIGGIKLLVDSVDLAEAEQILSQPIPERLDVSDVGDYEQPQCPKCGSRDITFHELAPAAYLSLAFRVPIPFRRRAWRCHSCDVEWEDDGVPGPGETAS
jgi:hypothetical protein